MQKVEAMIKPSRLEDIKRALNEIGINAMDMSEEHGVQWRESHTDMTRETELPEGVIPQMKINIIVESFLVERVLAVIAQHATAFSFVFLNVLGCVSPPPGTPPTMVSVNKAPDLPLKWPPEHVL